MPVITEWVNYGENEKYRAYVARMSEVKDPVASVLVIQEIWGLNDHIEDVTRRIAKAGYVAVAPDIFWRHGQRIDGFEQEKLDAASNYVNLVPSSIWRDPEKRQQSFIELNIPAEQQKMIAETLDRFSSIGALFPSIVEQLMETVTYMQENYPHSKGKGVASLGFCLGGGLSHLLATKEKRLKGAVCYYGQSPAGELIDGIQCPLIGFYAELDRITDDIPAFAEKMKEGNKSFEYYVYKGAAHGFFNDTRPIYNVLAARDAYWKTLQFLNKVLAE